MIIRANCKINIGLNILRRRDDGFHELETIMYPVTGLYDTLNINTIEGEGDICVKFSVEGIEVDCDAEDNLCVKSARLMQQRYGCGAVQISLDKQIPFGAGLAGGSSDAVAVLIAMNELFTLNLGESTLMDIAAELGSDTAFFVRNTPQISQGRGEILKPCDLDLSGWYLVMVKPHDIFVSTREAYSGILPCADQPPIEQLISLPMEMWQANVKNGFEKHIFEAYPMLAHIKSELIEAGAIYASMSGSGSTIYGLFRDSDMAQNLSIKGVAGYKPYILQL